MLHVYHLAFVGKARIPRDHEQPADAGESGDDLFDHAIGEIILLRIAAHIGERQDCNRRLVGQWQSLGRGREAPLDGDGSVSYPIDPNGPGNVFNLLLAQVLEDVIELVPYLIANDPANADPARLCQSFQARGHIDAVAEDVVLLDDYVAEIDAHTKPDPSILRDFGLALGHPPLHLDSAPNRVDHARELDQHPVAGVLYDPAPVLRDFRIDQLPEMSLQAFVRAPPRRRPSAANTPRRRRPGSRRDGGQRP